MKQSKALSFWIAFFIGAGCSLPYGNRQVTLGWENNRAVSLSIPESLAPGINPGSIATDISVTLGDSTGQAILGEFGRDENNIVFKPIVPFTRGLHYHVVYQMKIIGEFNVPMDDTARVPELSIYPSQDTLPENLIKMYFHFSEPMLEGKSLSYIDVLNARGDTLTGTFLDLQPELWNTEGTMLTLWFDPGRVKRDLIPNKTMGSPIIKGNEYRIEISADWKSKLGKALGKLVIKTFWVAARDEKIPDVNTWVLDQPEDTKEKLIVEFPEPLDYSLIQSSIQIVNERGGIVQGAIFQINEERGITFSPDQAWEKGNYILRVESKLEDLAGNNLNRPFDRDIKREAAHPAKDFFERKFVVQ